MTHELRCYSSHKAILPRYTNSNAPSSFADNIIQQMRGNGFTSLVIFELPMTPLETTCATACMVHHRSSSAAAYDLMPPTYAMGVATRIASIVACNDSIAKFQVCSLHPLNIQRPNRPNLNKPQSTTITKAKRCKAKIHV